MSGGEGLDQGRLRICAESVVVDAANGLDGEAAGFLSAFVTAHAVGHHRQAALAAKVLVGDWLPIKKGILVIGTLAADVGQAGRFDSGSWSLCVNGHSLRVQMRRELFLGTPVR